MSMLIMTILHHWCAKFTLFCYMWFIWIACYHNNDYVPSFILSSIIFLLKIIQPIWKSKWWKRYITEIPQSKIHLEKSPLLEWNAAELTEMLVNKAGWSQNTFWTDSYNKRLLWKIFVGVVVIFFNFLILTKDLKWRVSKQPWNSNISLLTTVS